MTKRQNEIIYALTVVSIILALLVSGRFWHRFDLTRTKAYTISKVSRNLYREIPDPVRITYYISDKLRTVVSAASEIEDTLREYAAFSRGKIAFTVQDPVRSKVSVNIEEYGIQPRQVQVVEKDQATLATVYSGIIIEYLDKIEVMPWVISTNSLEYDLTSRIRSMITDTERVIGVIIGDSYMSLAENFSYLNAALGDAGFNIRQISAGDEIPDNLPGLFVLGGVEELDEWALYRIDRYIQLGGKVLFAVNGVYIDTIYGSLEARHYNNQGLLDMIASYGVIVKPELALDRNALTLQYQSRTPSGSIQYRLTRYPLWIGVLGENTNDHHPVSADFSGLDLYWPSPLELAPAQNVEANVLFTTSNEAWLMREAFYTNPEIMYMLEMEAEQTRGKKILGVALSGSFMSFFKGAGKPVREGSNEELPDMPGTAGFSRIIVIGNLEFATNMMNATQAVNNLDFLLRAAGWIVNDDDIIGIRNRQPQAGRLDKITDISKRISAMRFSQIVNVVLVPLFVILTGFFLASKRRSRSVYLKETSGDV
jgi:gliding-associated putative ABC transporter substrate-binding component GldG